MDYGVYGSVMTVVMLVIFLAIVAWAWSAKRRSAFDAAARMPLEEDGAPGEPGKAGAHDKETGK
jgi:cytochrome c oxidase cbb3-type subunit 4